MNDLTRSLVVETAKANKALALRNDADFYQVLRSAWWTHIVAAEFWERMERAKLKLYAIHPEFFEVGEDGEIYILSYEPCAADVEVELSDRISDLIIWEAQDSETWRLDRDYGDLPVITVQPQHVLLSTPSSLPRRERSHAGKPVTEATPVAPAQESQLTLF